MAPKSKKCVFLGYGEPGEMGYRLWDPEARKIVRSNDVFFNEDKIHKKPIKIVEICSVVFQEDGQVCNKQVAQDEQHGQNTPMVQKVERNNRFKRFILFCRDLVEYIKLLIVMFHL